MRRARERTVTAKSTAEDQEVAMKSYERSTQERRAGRVSSRKRRLGALAGSVLALALAAPASPLAATAAAQAPAKSAARPGVAMEQALEALRQNAGGRVYARTAAQTGAYAFVRAKGDGLLS